jgi:hypothetical protein
MPKLYSLLEFRGQTFVLLELDEANDTAGVAEWRWSLSKQIAREFAPDMRATRWVSLAKLSDYRVVGNALGI